MKEIIELLLKYISIPALIAIGGKIAVQMKNKKATLSGSVASISVGLSAAYLSNDLVIASFSEPYHALLIGLIAILADKIMEYILYSFNVGTYIDRVINIIIKGKDGSD